MNLPMTTLRQACRVIPGFAFKSSDLADSGIPVVKIGSIADTGAVDLESGQFFPETLVEERHEKFFLNNGDIVLAMPGEGKVGRIRSEQRSLLNQRVCKLDPLEPDDQQYLWVAVRTIDYARVFAQLAQGAAQANISGGQLESLEIPWPQNSERRRIAETVSAYDDLIENNRRRMALLEETARQLYREWFVRLRFPGHEHTRITNGVPEGWERRRIGDVAECVGGGTPSTSVSSYWEDGDVTWVTPTDATRNRHFVLLASEKKITEAGLQNSSAKLVPPHAVLMTSRASVGFFAVAGREVCTNQGFISIVPKDATLWPYFLFHLSERVEEIRGMGSGSTYPEVSRGKFRELEVLLPKHSLPLAFGQYATELLKQIRVLKQQNEKLRTARDLLLPRLMSGHIAV